MDAAPIRTVPVQATHGRRRTITMVISAPMPPMYQVANESVRASGPTATAIALGTIIAVARASAQAHTGRTA